MEKAKEKVIHKVLKIDLQSLSLSDYNRNYLKNKFFTLSGVLDFYSNILVCALEDCNDLSDFCLVDYGAGSGILSILAIEAGIKKTIYNDIYDVSCKDVENLSKALSINLEHIVCGDTSNLVSYLQKNRILVDAIVSCDVIEHIYNPQEHFLILSQLQDKPFKLVYSSDANSKNSFVVKKLSDKQKRVEFQSRTNQYGVKKRDTLQSYWSVRRRIIKACDPNLSSDELDDLATRTRGLVKEDIHFLMKELQETGKINYIPDHSTNTCDPYTGNWCEHLMDFEWLIKMSAVHGFELDIMPGYFQRTGENFLKDLVKKILNSVIRLGGKKALAIAPRYTLYGHFKGNLESNSQANRN